MVHWIPPIRCQSSIAIMVAPFIISVLALIFLVLQFLFIGIYVVVPTIMVVALFALISFHISGSFLLSPYVIETQMWPSIVFLSRWSKWTAESSWKRRCLKSRIGYRIWFRFDWRGRYVPVSWRSRGRMDMSRPDGQMETWQMLGERPQGKSGARVNLKRGR